MIVFFRDPRATSAKSTLTRDDHVALLRGPEVYGRRERLGVALQLDVLSDVAAHQLVGNGQHRRDCDRQNKKKQKLAIRRSMANRGVPPSHDENKREEEATGKRTRSRQVLGKFGVAIV